MTNAMALGELLVSEKVITLAQRDEALVVQKQQGGRFGDVLVSLGFVSREQLSRLLGSVPASPRNLEQTGLNSAFLLDLLMKAAYVDSGTFSLQEISKRLCLPAPLVDELTEMAKTEHLVSIRSAAGYMRTTHVFELTSRGRERAEAAMDHCHYVGPAPVSFASYTLLVAHQSVRQIEVDEAWVRRNLDHLVVSDRMIDQLGPAINSGRSIFLYGPPGTGKSSISEALGRGLGGRVFIPHALEIGGQILRVFDPAVHVPVEEPKEGEVTLDLAAAASHDARWQACQRPVVMVGGELTLHELELDYNPTSKYYEAPIHMKANNGVFILDDFGRQQVSPRQLLNRWIVPLERGTDFLNLHTGQKIEAPFDQITVFCTNLKPSELVDEAFLRRIRHKIKVDYQTEAEYLEILRRVCADHGIEFRADAAQYLIDTYYRKTGRPLVGSHPRDLVEQIVDRARYYRSHAELLPTALDFAAGNYFVEL